MGIANPYYGGNFDVDDWDRCSICGNIITSGKYYADNNINNMLCSNCYSMVHQAEIYLDQCIKAFCTVHLNDEYYSLCINLKEKLIFNGTITFLEKNIKIWAATIIYAICYLNDLLPTYITPKIIHDFFGFTAVDVSNRAHTITRGIYHKYEYWANNNKRFNNEFHEKNKTENNYQNSSKEKYSEYKKEDTKKDENVKIYSSEYLNYCRIMELETGFIKEQLKNKYRELM